MLTSYEQHDLANAHPLNQKGYEAADKAQAAHKAKAKAKAARLMAKADKLREEAWLLENAASRDSYGHDVYQATQDAYYWAARRLVAAEHGIPLEEVVAHEKWYYEEQKSNV